MSAELQAAEKDNDLIYLMPVPDEQELLLPAPAMMAANQLPPEVSAPGDCLGKVGRQLFLELAPAVVHEALKLYQQRREDLIDDKVTRVYRRLTEERETTIRETQTRALLQTLEQPIGLPPSLIASAQDIRAKGGMQELDALMEHADTLAATSRAALSKIIDMLDTQNASTDILAALKSRARTLSSKLEAAAKSDSLVKERASIWRERVELMTSGQEHLEKLIPSYQETLSREENSCAAVLRHLIARADKLEKRTEEEEASIRHAIKEDNIGK
ncbi:hypothetical protein THASP1DRAFT_32132 [Thamnocephalis sphaerospora]|uniref:Uncharacterized protein n=1 Tax=Thamnocephalis sphaerospora TaxID=78915 RepID=A0A4V1IW21_9FUNG|nr:hypothetical protein THASP1DRAFT_32132 [Thamnocephalis sphaerospora]|eukprot:RKP06039.1 hypothetical protein THASP1DRAFT_32132 [Thamnocephalis sphaerospora]